MSVVARRYYLRGRKSLSEGEHDAAIEALSSAVDLAPTFTAARVALSAALAKFGDYPRAIQVIRAGLTRPTPAASRGLLWATLGDLLAGSGDFPAAEEAYQHCEQDADYAGRASAGRARIHAKMGRYRESFAELAKAAGVEPKS
ncbi:MAG: tetratricopeptide repeat protein [Deltaproteobacteria bacterium]|jgi:tetratricopeptide (TPR) repeat protein|nr:tetratricopeptide repeat protein [Deltaproteobacteria bacterium]